jgi:hypothetical protein
MPIKSQAQRRKFAELLMKGEISEEVYERWNREAGYKVLPERVKPKGERAAKTKTKKKTASRTKKRAATKKTSARAKRKTSSRSRKS